MSLLDRAKYQIKSITNLTSSTVSYGLIGISTAILGYYTFFENDIEIPAPEVQIGTPLTEQPSTEQPSTEQPSTEQPSTEQPTTEQPSTEQPSTQQPTTQQPTTQQQSTEQPSTEPQKNETFFGGKKKKKVA